VFLFMSNIYYVILLRHNWLSKSTFSKFAVSTRNILSGPKRTSVTEGWGYDIHRVLGDKVVSRTEPVQVANLNTRAIYPRIFILYR
ncbi:hypothetical protein L9F63_004163, partial [Diploptera punctata]